MPAMPNAFAEEATDFCITLENKSDPSELGANTFNWHLMMLSLYACGSGDAQFAVL